MGTIRALQAVLESYNPLLQSPLEETNDQTTNNNKVIITFNRYLSRDRDSNRPTTDCSGEGPRSFEHFQSRGFDKLFLGIPQIINILRKGCTSIYTMPKASTKTTAFYAVHTGRRPGIYSNWSEVEAQVNGYPNARHKKFTNVTDAQNFLLTGQSHSSSIIKNCSSAAPGKSASSRPKNQSNHHHGQYQDGAFQTSSFLSSVGCTSQISNYSNSSQQTVVHQAESNKPYYRVYCDGACSGNGRKGVQTPAGSGVWWQDTGLMNPSNIAKRLPGPAQSNNRAELYAIWLALQSDPDPNSKMEILTDSQYSINCFGKWLPKWLSNNYKKSSGEPVENQDLIEAIRLKLEFRDRLNPRGVVFTYVKGHSGDYGNTQADKLARIGATLDPIDQLFL